MKAEPIARVRARLAAVDWAAASERAVRRIAKILDGHAAPIDPTDGVCSCGRKLAASEDAIYRRRTLWAAGRRDFACRLCALAAKRETMLQLKIYGRRRQAAEQNRAKAERDSAKVRGDGW